MTHPVFFSVADEDKLHAQQVAEQCASDHVYLYSITGKEGANFPEEISNELSSCSYFVIFWSASYVKKEWTRRELAIAAKRLRSGELNEFLIVRLDPTPLDKRAINPLTEKEEEILRPFRDKRRATNLPFNAVSVLRHIGDALATLSPAKTPLLPRSDLENKLRQEIAIDFTSTNPLIFVSGLNGSGRKTLVRSVMDRDFAHLIPNIVAIDNMDGPEDLLFKLWRDVLGKAENEVETLAKMVSSKPEIVETYLNMAVRELTSRKVYLLITQDALGSNENALPFWVGKYLGDLKPTNHPLIFYVLSRQISAIM